MRATKKAKSIEKSTIKIEKYTVSVGKFTILDRKVYHFELFAHPNPPKKRRNKHQNGGRKCCALHGRNTAPALHRGTLKRRQDKRQTRRAGGYLPPQKGNVEARRKNKTNSKKHPTSGCFLLFAIIIILSVCLLFLFLCRAGRRECEKLSSYIYLQAP